MFTLEITDDDLSLALVRPEDGLSDMTPVMQDLGDYLIKSTQDRMLRGEQPDGTPFAPRSPTTLEKYAARGFRSFGPPLNLFGYLRESIAFQAGPDGVAWGSNENKLAVMQFGAEQGAFGTNARGAPSPWGDIPARPYVGLSDEDLRYIVADVEDRLEDLAKGRQ